MHVCSRVARERKEGNQRNDGTVTLQSCVFLFVLVTENKTGYTCVYPACCMDPLPLA